MLLIFLLYFFSLAISQNLLLLQSVFRHGARYALSPMFQPSTPPSLIGQLTSVGKRMHYLLGQHLYSQYWQRLSMPNYYNASLIRVNSTDFNRTIESCQSQLFGWLQTIQKQKYNDEPIFDDINFQPVPINVYQKNILYSDGEGEPMLYYNYPNNDKWKGENYRSDFYMHKVKPIVELEMQTLKEGYGLEFGNITELVAFIDTYHSNKSLGYNLHPIFKVPRHKGYLQFIYIVSLYLDIFYSPGQITVSTTQFFAQLKQNLLATVRGTTPIKLRLYSAHDVTLMNLLVGFNLSNAELVYQKYIVENTTKKGPWSFPPYASNLLFQLLKSEQNIPHYYSHYNIDSNYIVKIRYNGEYLDLGFCKDQKRCSIQDFLNYLDKSIDPNYKVLGGFYRAPIDRSGSLIVMSVMLAIYVGYKVMKMVKRRGEGDVSSVIKMTDGVRSVASNQERKREDEKNSDEKEMKEV